MAKTFVAGLSGKTGKAQGFGMKIVDGRVDMGPASEAIHAKDIGLTSIYSLFVNPSMGTYGGGTLGLAIIEVNTPGSMNNYASVHAHRLYVNALSGTLIGTVTSGSYPFRYLAIGE